MWEGQAGLFQTAWLIGAIACIVGIAQRTRADLLAPPEVKLKLRSFPLGSMAFARYAYNEAPEPTRTRLRTSALAYIVFLLSWTVGAVWMAPWLAPVGIVGAGAMAWRLRQAERNGS